MEPDPLADRRFASAGRERGGVAGARPPIEGTRSHNDATGYERWRSLRLPSTLAGTFKDVNGAPHGRSRVDGVNLGAPSGARGKPSSVVCTTTSGAHASAGGGPP